jgi:hypothetical protein
MDIVWFIPSPVKIVFRSDYTGSRILCDKTTIALDWVRQNNPITEITSWVSRYCSRFANSKIADGMNKKVQFGQSATRVFEIAAVCRQHVVLEAR